MRLAVVVNEASSGSPRPRVAPDAGSDRPIDLVHLARATDGDEALEAELLAMFSRQAEKLGERVRSPEPSRQARADMAHRLRGSALAIGAFAVAEAAGNLEAALEGEGGEPHAELTALERTLADARAAISQLSG